MANPQKRKGAKAELEVAAILSDLLGLDARRALGAGRLEDTGDIFGLPDTVVQVANYIDLARAVREKLPASERQRENAGVSFAATFVRRYGGGYVVMQTPLQWSCLWRDAVYGSGEKAA